jgi:hypothetical protein
LDRIEFPSACENPNTIKKVIPNPDKLGQKISHTKGIRLLDPMLLFYFAGLGPFRGHHSFDSFANSNKIPTKR